MRTFDLKACPMCLADLVMRATERGVSYVCQSCGAVEINVRSRIAAAFGSPTLPTTAPHLSAEPVGGE